MSDKTTIFGAVPWADIIDALEALAEAGIERDQAIDMIASMLDQAIPFDTLVPGPAGAALEAIDGPVLRAGLRAAWAFVSDEDKRSARRARRAERRAA